MQQSLRSLLFAVQFFTRLPLPVRWMQWADFSPARMQAAIAYMPVAGWLVGGVAAAAFAAVVQLWGTTWMWRAPVLLMALAALASTAAGIWLTGAMHEDGLADVADALLGSAGTERALQIMKDPCVGSYAVLMLVLCILGKTMMLTTLALLDLPVLLYLLVMAHVLSRFFPLWLTHHLPHVGLKSQSKTQQMAGMIRSINMWPAFCCCLPLLGVYCLPRGDRLLLLTGLCAMAAATVAAGMGWWFKRRLQGFTGDCLGATQQVCELACYAVTLTVWV